ncbi:MAG TPA: DUF308 domain-containing protein [Micromonosporaceae bacterium]
MSDVAVVAVSERDDARFTRIVRLTAVIGGVLAIALGVILLVWPKETVYVVTALLGLQLVIAGALSLVRALFTPEHGGAGGRIMPAIGGLVTVAVGVICLRHLSGSVVLLASIFAIAWLISGIAEIFGAFSHRDSESFRTGMLIFGIVSVIGAITVLVWPQMSLVTLAVVVGIWLIAAGIAQLVVGWRLRSTEAVRAAMTIG